VTVVGPLPGVAAAAILGPAAAVLARRLAHRPVRAGPEPALPLALDLAAAALRGGQTITSALVLTAAVLPEPLAGQWRRTAGLLALGAPGEQAWSALAEHEALAPVAVIARRSADSGVRLARALTQLAADTRAQLRAQELARAGRAGVLVLAPLGLCFLPAFVCLGIVPTIVGIARGAFATLL
jgi:pilus assembly protein TadC